MSDIDRLQEAYERNEGNARVQYQIGTQLELVRYRMTQEQEARQREIVNDFRRRVLRVMQPRH